MKVEIEIPDYNPTSGVPREWDVRDNLQSEWHQKDGEFVIIANSEALHDLAVHLLTLAQKEVPVGTHMHYDSFNFTAAENSTPFVVIKI